MRNECVRFAHLLIGAAEPHTFIPNSSLLIPHFVNKGRTNVKKYFRGDFRVAKRKRY